MKRVLITGANSYIGTSFEKYVRKHYNDELKIDTIDMVDGTWRGQPFQTENGAPYDCVFHVVGIAHADVGKMDEATKARYYAVNTDLAIETAEKAKNDGCSQFILMSSMIIYGDSAPYGKPKRITRDTKPHPTNFYGDSKWRADKGVRRLEDESFLVAVIRSPMIYGKGSKGNYTTLARIAKKISVFPDIQNERSMLYIENLCEFLCQIMIRGEGGIFWPQNAEYTSTSGLVKLIAEVNGHKIFISKAFNWLVGLSSYVSGKIGVLTNKAFGNLSYDQSISRYGFNYQLVDLKTSIERTDRRKMRSVKKRVLQIISYMYPAISGNGQTAYDISNCLSRDEYNQMIICFNTTGFVDVHDAKGTQTVHEKLNGIPITRCGVVTNIASQLLAPSYPAELKRAIKGFKPDLVILHCPNPFLAEFVLPFLKNREFKLILYWHSDIVKQKLIGKLFNRQNMKLLTYADRIVVTSPNYIDGSEFLRRFRDKCIVVPSCIREDQNVITAKSEKLAEEIRQNYRGKVICFALGRHVPYKGFEYLIEACKYLDDKYEVLIGGEGSLTEKLKELAKDDNKVHFTGRLSPEELQACYLASDIFCFSSITKNEAYGLALCDALYYGKPAVTFKIPGSGVNYVSPAGMTGIECPNRDSKAYAEAIKKLGSDEKLRVQYGENGKKRANELFLYKRFKENINQLVSELTMGKRHLTNERCSYSSGRG